MDSKSEEFDLEIWKVFGRFSWRVYDCEELSGGGQSHN
jgi:hypothetical protein